MKSTSKCVTLATVNYGGSIAETALPLIIPIILVHIILDMRFQY